MIFVLKKIHISSRSSDLAQFQAFAVGEQILQKNPELEIEYHFRESLGDKNLHDPLWKMPEKGVFTEDFHLDLVSGKTDLVVHSWKDLPTEVKPETKIAATIARADSRDVLLFKKSSFNKSSVKIFSSSPRRIYNLQEFLTWSLPWKIDQVEFSDVRGNIPTRVRKLLQNTNVDGLVVAKAALDRLTGPFADRFAETKSFLLSAMQDLQWQVLPLSLNPTAAAQGALAIETLRDRADLQKILDSIHDPETFKNVELERTTLKKYGGGCHQKIGISFVDTKHASVYFLKGLTTAGQVLSEAQSLTQAQQQYAAEELLDSRELWREVARAPLQNFKHDLDKPCLITKPDALHFPLSEHQIKWTSGVGSWQKLAAQGLWIHGSLDQLGEQQLPAMQNWMGDHPKTWTKLTHEEKSNPSYQVTRHPVENVPRHAKMIFWHSGSEFLQASAQWPGLKNLRHACGLGNTADFLKYQLQPKQLEVYFNAAEWRIKCQK